MEQFIVASESDFYAPTQNCTNLCSALAWPTQLFEPLLPIQCLLL